MNERQFTRLFDAIKPHLPFQFYNVMEKGQCATVHTLYTLCRTQSMFEWKGLPDTIPQRDFEIMLQCNGNVCFAKVDGNLYVFTGGLGGEPNVYYRPTVYTVANPALNYNANLVIGRDCEIVRNDSMMLGLLPIISKYANAMTETELSIYDATINSRLISLITCPDDRTAEAARKFIEDVIAGKLSVLADNALLDGIKAQPYGTTGNRTITDLIELNQYQRACLFNDLGLNANYNMKRESINSNESQLNDDMLLPFVDDMLRCRQEGIEKVNAMFGTNITVDFYSSWKDNVIEIEEEQEPIKTGDNPETEQIQIKEGEN